MTASVSVVGARTPQIQHSSTPRQGAIGIEVPDPIPRISTKLQGPEGYRPDATYERKSLKKICKLIKSGDAKSLACRISVARAFRNLSPEMVFTCFEEALKQSGDTQIAAIRQLFKSLNFDEIRSVFCKAIESRNNQVLECIAREYPISLKSMEKPDLNLREFSVEEISRAIKFAMKNKILPDSPTIALLMRISSENESIREAGIDRYVENNPDPVTNMSLALSWLFFTKKTTSNPTILNLTIGHIFKIIPKNQIDAAISTAIISKQYNIIDSWAKGYLQFMELKGIIQSRLTNYLKPQILNAIQFVLHNEASPNYLLLRLMLSMTSGKIDTQKQGMKEYLSFSPDPEEAEIALQWAFHIDTPPVYVDELMKYLRASEGELGQDLVVLLLKQSLRRNSTSILLNNLSPLEIQGGLEYVIFENRQDLVKALLLSPHILVEDLDAVIMIAHTKNLQDMERFLQTERAQRQKSAL